jgi:alkaline phosphatase D
MLGSEQEVWLDHVMRKSVKAGQRWQVVGFGTIMGKTHGAGRGDSDGSSPTPLRSSASGRTAGVMAASSACPTNFDNWGGYPAARARFLKIVAGGAPTSS